MSPGNFISDLVFRIPLGLFPLATQNRILEVLVEEEDEARRYVESSSFRRGQSKPTSSTTERFPQSLPDILTSGSRLESDSTYERTLNIFVPPSFF